MKSKDNNLNKKEKVFGLAFGKELKVLEAVKLFEMVRLSSGRSSELAGMNWVGFLHNSTECREGKKVKTVG